MTSRVVVTVALMAAALLALSACTSEAAPQSTGSSEAVATPSASASASSGADDETTEVTCENLISTGLIDSFESLGWTVEEAAFRIGPTEYPDGLLCTWADYASGGEQLQFFGWAPLTAEETESAIASLTADGWTREEGDAGVYLTESAETVNPGRADDDGYGWTYLFGDGWVTRADTKASLLLIKRPTM